jgi:hypothetical protein
MAQTVTPPPPDDGSDFTPIQAAQIREDKAKRAQDKLDRRERALQAAITFLGPQATGDRVLVVATARDFLDFLEGGDKP